MHASNLANYLLRRIRQGGSGPWKVVLTSPAHGDSMEATLADDPETLLQQVTDVAAQIVEQAKDLQDPQVALLCGEEIAGLYPPKSSQQLAERERDPSMPGMPRQIESAPMAIAPVAMALMKHVEKLMETNMRLSTQVHDRDAETIRDLQRQIDRVGKSYWETLQMQEELVSRRHEREMEEKALAAENARKAELMGLIKGYAPVLLTRIKQHAENNSVSKKLGEILGKCSPEQLGTALAALPEDARVELLEVIQSGGKQA